MSRKIPQLDAVRGIAILVVMIHNLHGFTSLPFSYLTAYGWMGVDLFFVLSGFLITGILLDARPAENYFRNFYARRCLRIWPLYYLVLFVMFVVVPLMRPQEAAEIFRRSHPWWSYLFFLQNFLVETPAAAMGALGVTWSLAVEELFYLVWPFFVRVLPESRLRLFAWSVLLLSPPMRLMIGMHGGVIYSNPFCRLDGMMAGALLAMLARRPGFESRRLLPFAWASLPIAGALAIFTDIYSANWLTFSMTTLASAALMYLALFSSNSWLRAVFTNRFLMFSGTISYGLYLLHKFPANVFKAFSFDTAYPRLAFAAALVISYLLAIASWNFLEKPFLSLKSLFENKRVALAAPEMIAPKPVVRKHPEARAEF